MITVARSFPAVSPAEAVPPAVVPPVYVRRHPVTPRRVYVRRRVVAAAVALLLVAGALVGLGRVVGDVVAPGGDPASAPGGRATLVVHVVQPGDTLWALARRLQPTGDVRPLVDRMVELNGGSSLEVGQRILLPG